MMVNRVHSIRHSNSLEVTVRKRFQTVLIAEECNHHEQARAFEQQAY